MSLDQAQTAGNTTSRGLTYKLISSEPAFVDLGSSWDDLVRAMPRPSPFLLHGWLVEWYRHYGGGAGLAIQTAFRDDKLVGAFPLVHRPWRGLRVARFLGGEQSSLADVLLSPAEERSTAAALIDRAAAQHDFAELFGLSRGSRLASIAAPGELHLFKRADGPVLELTDDWDALYQAKLSSKKRSSFRRRRQELERVGTVEFVLARARKDVEAALEDCFRLHLLRWAGRPDGSGFATDAGVSFHRAALAALAEQDVVRLITLRLDGHAIAFALAFACAGRLYGYRMAFDPSFARQSPGLLTLHQLLAAACEEGLERAELLGAADRFKLELADDLEPLHLGLGLARTPPGRAVVTIRTGVRRLRERVSRSTTARRAYDRARPLLTRVARTKNVLRA
jgi:CelD/BcsL family acetyltransferase involved in cellulose biosynthesis